MRRRILSIFLLCLMISMNQGYAQFKKGKDDTSTLEDNKSNLKGNFQKNKFSKESKSLDSDEMHHFNAPDPGDAPISNGLWMLLIGSTVYITNRIRKEKK